jgi:hypothetical protein
MSDQIHDPSVVPLGSTPVPIEQEAGWSRESVWSLKNNLLPLPRVNPLDILPTACSLHWLNYPGFLFHGTIRNTVCIHWWEYSIGWFCKPWARLYLFVVNAGLFFITVVFFDSGLLPTMSSLNVTTKLGVWRRLTVRLEVCYGFWTDNKAWLPSLVRVSDLDDLCSDLRVVRLERRLGRNWQLQ